jgi:hypothetical protein
MFIELTITYLLNIWASWKHRHSESQSDSQAHYKLNSHTQKGMSKDQLGP